MRKDVQEFSHYPVMLEETIQALDPKPGLIYFDCTLGGGGHSKEIVKRIVPDGKLISLDVDPVAIEAAKEVLSPWKENVTILKANYSKVPEVLRALNIEKISGGIVFDLGASYYQLTADSRGFSFVKDSPLDMRFDPENDKTAYDVVNGYSQEDLASIFKEYGEERFAKRVARRIVEKRNVNPIKTTVELANIVRSAVPAGKQKIHPATRVFQAIRIEVNNELENVKNTLNGVIPLLGNDARIVVISFHSLEDRLVKNTFKYYSLSCKCLPNQLICSCGPRQLEIITKKPVVASEEEIRRNPPSRSAKLRAARKV